MEAQRIKRLLEQLSPGSGKIQLQIGIGRRTGKDALEIRKATHIRLWKKRLQQAQLHMAAIKLQLQFRTALQTSYST